MRVNAPVVELKAPKSKSLRRTAIPAVAGRYFYSDWCGGWLRSFRYANGAAIDKTVWPGIALGSVTSFGEDAAGELYVMNGGGFLYKIVAGTK